MCRNQKDVTHFAKNRTSPDGYQNHCRECAKPYAIRSNAKLRADTERYIRHQVAGRPAQRRGYLLREFGITPEDFANILRLQGGKCAICKTTDPPKCKRSGEGWHIDHDHATGKIRGVLCHHCNVLLGSAKDDQITLLRAVHYLECHRIGCNPASVVLTQTSEPDNRTTEPAELELELWLLGDTI